MKAWVVLVVGVLLATGAAAEILPDVSRNRDDFFTNAMSQAEIIPTDERYQSFREFHDTFLDSYEGSKCSVLPSMYDRTAVEHPNGQLEKIRAFTQTFIELTQARKIMAQYDARAQSIYAQSSSASAYCCAFVQLVSTETLEFNKASEACDPSDKQTSNVIAREPTRKTLSEPIMAKKERMPAKSKQEEQSRTIQKAEVQKVKPAQEQKKEQERKESQSQITGLAVKDTNAEVKQGPKAKESEGSKASAALLGVFSLIAIGLLVALMIRSRPKSKAPVHPEAQRQDAADRPEKAQESPNAPEQRESHDQFEESYQRIEKMLQKMKRL